MFMCEGKAMSVIKKGFHGFGKFITSESGAITVDWVVLTAAITGLGIAATVAVRTGTTELGSNISTSLTNTQLPSLGCLASSAGTTGFECYTGPTIVDGLVAWVETWEESCSSDSGGTVTCSPAGSEFTEQYIMSDGSTYNKVIRTENGETTVTWTDIHGNPVETPPPMT